MTPYNDNRPEESSSNLRRSNRRHTMIVSLNQQPLLAMLLIISAGYFIGRITIKGFSLDSSAILFVALFAGHTGIVLPGMFRTFGLALFIYAIGLQAGPSLSRLFRKDGMRMNFLALVIVASGALTAFLSAKITGISPEIAGGIFTGALTSTPGLAAAQEATSSPMTSIGYGVAYPFGVILVILFIKLLPRLLRIDPIREAEDEAHSQAGDPLQTRQIEVTNPSLNGKTLAGIDFQAVTGAIISRMLRNGQVAIPHGQTTLQLGDVVRLVGTAKALDTAELLLGRTTAVEIPAGDIEMNRFIVTNRKIVARRIADINLAARYNATVTRIHRNGIDLPGSAGQKIEWGDRLTVVGEKTIMPSLKELFGNDIKQVHAGDIYSIILGIAFGILLGMIPISIGKVIHFKMGISGGILLSGLLLGNRSKTGFILWRAPAAIINFVRETGLVLFLSVVGCESGKTIFEVLSRQGFSLIAVTVLVALVPMALTTFIARRFLRMKLLTLSGLLTGGMTSTPGLAVATSLADSSSPMIVYASVYPIAMIGMIILVRLLILL